MTKFAAGHSQRVHKTLHFASRSMEALATTRALMAVAAFQWRKLAQKAAEREKRSWPLVPEVASIAVAGGLVDCLSVVCLRVS
jgi:hypothetical protein